MTNINIWQIIFIILICPAIGGLPLIDWLTYTVSKRKLTSLGTGNISVSAAFYHGGKIAGILAVLSEAAKGIIVVLLARGLFPSQPTWELIGLIALVIGRYWLGKGAGTTNVTWGIICHDPYAAGLIFIISGISFTIFRERKTGKLLVLILLVVILALRHPKEHERIIAAIALSLLLAWIYQQIPDDLNLAASDTNMESKKMFRFFRGDKNIISLDSQLDANKVGEKAAKLSQLKRWGYAVPDGWVLMAGDDPQVMIQFLEPTVDEPLVVRSSAVGEDSDRVSFAGQYTTILNVTNREELQAAILDCWASYNNENARLYRQDRGLEETPMAIVIQKLLKGIISGVAFSRDPVKPNDECIIIEALAGDATQVVSGKITPQQYRVNNNKEVVSGAEGDIPIEIIKKVAEVAKEIETRYHGIPQDIEWTYDGEQIWLLQTRPITNLQPIWTRKIAAEVIPGVIRPLTWSINQPLTCGVWGDIFSIVLGDRARGMNFTETATLHFNRAYFNATLLGEIFLQMGLPPESLEFLTMGARMSKPPLAATIKNIPGLMRLLSREWALEKNFARDKKLYFAPILQEIEAQKLDILTPEEILERSERILLALKKATYYSILAPLSLALRQAIFKVKITDLDNSKTPEIEAMRSLARLAVETREIVNNNKDIIITEKLNQWLETFGYLGEVGTDIAIPRWKEAPQPIKDIFIQYIFNPKEISQATSKNKVNNLVQKRLNLKGEVTEIYSKLLSYLRWGFVALEEKWLQSGLLEEKGDIFFIEYSEIISAIKDKQVAIKEKITSRKEQFRQNQEISNIPYVVYGSPRDIPKYSNITTSKQLRGIAASPGEIIGRVKILTNIQNATEIDKETIIVVPYTDSGWVAILARAGGIIAEVGGSLSHGAIIAREYNIPAVMNIHNASQILQNNQRVRLDGYRGVVEIVE